MGRVFKWLGIVFAAVVAAVVAAIVVAGILYEHRPVQRTAGGVRRVSSIYVTMNDGARIAVTVTLPASLKAAEKIPALIKGTPYWRGAEFTLLGKALAEFGLISPHEEPDVEPLTERGYAVVGVDTRGTGASFGHQAIMFDDREVADFGEIIDWAARQPWSNGRVGAYGFSYRGILATDMASLGHPALKAIAPSFDFPDLYLTAHPGGVFSTRFIEAWGTQTAGLNQGRLPCGFVCTVLFAGPKRVDGDGNGTLVAQAIAEHAGDYDVFACARNAPDRDSKICTSGKSLSDISEISRKAAIEKAGLPIYVIAGYFDATSPAEVLYRFSHFSNPQTVTMSAISHGGFMSTDPFAAKTARADPRYAAQIAGMADFFDTYLKGDGKPMAKSLHYLMLNGGGWRISDSWPPHGVKSVDLFLAAEHALSSAAPTADGGDRYRVDFTASSGIPSRYELPVALSQTAYPDRAAQDKKLLTYTSAALDAPIEIAGDPVAKLVLSSTAGDGEVIVYLEDVAPNGKVTYLTEGVLRLLHRKIGASALSSDPFHSYLASDAAPMVPGKAEPIEIALSPVAAVLHKGDRIRVAIAGADADNLERLPAKGDATLTVSRSAAAPSLIELPELTK